jgi:hypothetical protein
VRRAAALSAAALALVGCGNNVTADVNGSTAIAVDKSGNVVVLAAICHSMIDEVTISADRTGLKETEENKILGTWKSRKPMKGLVSLNLAEPGADWTTTSTFVPEDAKGYIVLPEQTKADVEAEQVYFHGRDLAKLTPDQVIVEDGKIQKRSTFEKSCD